MKLQKRLSRKYKGKIYHKFLVVIPKENVKRSGFKEGDELYSEIKKGEIKLKKKSWKKTYQNNKLKKK